jgi:hypothetical protein
MDPATPIDPSRCPLCGQPNACSMHAAQVSGEPVQPCWCATQTFSAELLARIPLQAQRKACVCQGCANTAR